MEPFMKRFGYRIRRMLMLSGAALAGLMLISYADLWAEPTGQPQQPTAAEPIHITSDRLESDSTAKSAEFIGSVLAIQGDTEIRCDRLKIFYKKNLGKEAAVAQDALSKIVASGNVEIKFDNRVAVTDEAVYITDEKILVLTGPNSKITSGKDSISGSRIIFHREGGNIRVEGAGDRRVEALLFPEKKVMN
jgi:lipopolysaccharide export system protein LptA